MKLEMKIIEFHTGLSFNFPLEGQLADSNFENLIFLQPYKCWRQ